MSGGNSEFEVKKRLLIKKKRKKRMKRRMLVFLFLFACVGIIFTVLKAPFFNVKTVICVGQSELSEQELTEIAGVKIGANIFSTGTKTMIRRLKENPRIAECNVRRLFPDKIKIWVRESKAKVAIETETEFLLTDAAGKIVKVLAKNEGELPEGTARLKDFEPNSKTEGEIVFDEADVKDKKIFELVSVLDKLEMLEKITEICAADLSDIRLDYEDRLYIMLGSYDNMEYRLTFIKTVISENIAESGTALLDYRGQTLYVGSRETEKEEGAEPDGEFDTGTSEPEPSEEENHNEGNVG